MAERRLKRGWIALGAAALGALLWFGVPPLARRMAFFRVRRVELVGAQHLPADRILAALDLPKTVSVWHDFGSAAARVRQLRGVDRAAVGRRLPGTVRVTIVETTPVALLAREKGMQVLDARGRVLPYDAWRSAPDLPVAANADSGLTALLARVREGEPALYARTAAAWRVRDDVVLQVEGRRYWFRPDATAEDMRAVTAVAQDLARKGRSFAELDGRFAGQVVVRWPERGA